MRFASISLRSCMLAGAIALAGCAVACSNDEEIEATATPTTTATATTATDATQAPGGAANLEAYGALVEDVTGAFPDVTLIEDTGAYEVGGLVGDGRRVLIFGTAADLPSFIEIEQTLRGILEADGWTEDMQYAADGPGATMSVWRKGEEMAVLSAGVSPQDPGACPADRSIGECLEGLDPATVNVQGSISVANR